jgi:hypothetical protein
LRIAIEVVNHDAFQKMTTILTDTKAMVAYWDKSSYQTPERRRANFKVIVDKSKMSCHKSDNPFIIKALALFCFHN